MTAPSSKPVPKPINDSFFHMWRGVIIMAHADGIIHEKEREFFESLFEKMAETYALTPGHLQVFAADLETAQDVETVLPHITDLEHRSLLLFFCQAVAWIDGNLNPDEAELLTRLHRAFGQGAGQVMADIRLGIVDQMSRRKFDLEERHIQRNPLFYAIDALLGRLGIPPLD
jgi:hypothetical protein